jgi:hypothetical protein
MSRWLLLVVWLTYPLWAQQQAVKFVFLEPVPGAASPRETPEALPLFRRVADASSYMRWLRNESVDRAIRLYRAAYNAAHREGATPNYYIALVKGGNHAAVGFRIQEPGGITDYRREPYILLEPQQYRFETTLLHETGHMAMALVAGGRLLNGAQMASIPHSTATLSDRTTAFVEGYAIHLEALQAQVGSDPALRQRYRHEQVVFGNGPYQAVEYFRDAGDLLSYSQNLTRYQEVRDNAFAFDGAFQGPEYLRVQLEKSRDFSTLRTAGQLLQSEGFYASFFFLWAMRGTSMPNDAAIDRREADILDVMKSLFEMTGVDHSEPWLLVFVKHYMEHFPADKTAIVDALNDLSHGVFIDASASRVWKDHYLAALSLDIPRLRVEDIMSTRRRWHQQAEQAPESLFAQLGPELHCTVPGTHVRIVALNLDAPVQFDLNTVQPGILRIIPGISEDEVSTLLAERARKPFASIADFRARGFLRPAVLGALSTP